MIHRSQVLHFYSTSLTILHFSQSRLPTTITISHNLLPSTINPPLHSSQPRLRTNNLPNPLPSSLFLYSTPTFYLQTQQIQPRRNILILNPAKTIHQTDTISNFTPLSSTLNQLRGDRISSHIRA